MIKVLVDSASDISLAEAKELGIEMIPMEIFIDGETYKDGVDLTGEEFFKKLVECSDFPRTSQINEYRWEEKFKELTKNGDEVIAITISSKLSGCYSQAVLASESFPGVRVIDSLNACIGERILVEYAIRLVNDGMILDDIVTMLNDKKSKIKLLALLDTLEYLKKGGRISTAVAIAGTIFNIKPVISLYDGTIKVEGKARGSRKANNLLTTMIKESNGIDFSMPFTTGYSGFETTLLDKYIEDSKELWINGTESLSRHLIGSTIGTHIGPGGVAVAFFEK